MELDAGFCATRSPMGNIFVAGCGHSGTSLAAIMLGAHSQIYAIPFETNAFLDEQTAEQGRHVINEAAARCTKRHARYICEKTPRHIRYIDKIITAFPDARIVLTIRDPRDVVCSIKRRYGNLNAGIKRWRSDNELVRQTLTLQHTFLLRYEELVENPEGTLGCLCEFLGLSYEPNMLTFWRDDRNWFGAMDSRDTDGTDGINHLVRRNWQIHQPLMRTRVGVWQKELDAEEVTGIIDSLGPFAAKMGYPLSIDFPDQMPTATANDATEFPPNSRAIIPPPLAGANDVPKEVSSASELQHVGLSDVPTKRKIALAAVLIAKDEGPYLLEWIAHHRAIGFDLFVLYDNESADQTRKIIRSLKRMPGIIARRWPTVEGVSPQRSAYNHALQRLKRKGIDYAAFLDADEFLVPTSDLSIKSILLGLETHLPDFGALSVNYRDFGPNGHERYSAAPVMRRFPRRLTCENPYVKTIYRLSHVDEIIDPHRSILRDGYSYNSAAELLHYNSQDPGIVKRQTFSLLQVNHYMTKSREEFDRKRARGGGWRPTVAERRARHDQEIFDRYQAGEAMYDIPTAIFARSMGSRILWLRTELFARGILRKLARPLRYIGVLKRGRSIAGT